MRKTGFLKTGSYDVRLLSGRQIYDLYNHEFYNRVKDEDGRDVMPSFKNIPFLKTDRLIPELWSRGDIQSNAIYVCVFENEELVGVRKFYEIPKNKAEINKVLEDQGLPLVQGQIWTSGYISVREDRRRKGIASLMNEFILDLMEPGDVFCFGRHEPDGAKLDQTWLSKNKSRFNLFEAGYNNAYAYIDYDPRQKNLVITDGLRVSSAIYRLAKVVASYEYETKSGQEITFKFYEDDPKDRLGIDKGYKNQRVEAYIDQELVGYLKWSYIPSEQWDKMYPSIWYWIKEKFYKYNALFKPDDLKSIWSVLFTQWGLDLQTPPLKYKSDLKQYLNQHIDQVKGFEISKNFWVDKPTVTMVATKGSLQFRSDDGKVWTRKGIAVALYKYAAKLLAKKGLSLWEDHQTQTNDAKQLWLKLKSMEDIPTILVDNRTKIDYRDLK